MRDPDGTLKTFVDVGAHQGQTLWEVCKPEYAFDEIHAIEPMPAQHASLVRSFWGDPRVRIHGFALGEAFGVLTMYGTNDQLEASAFPSKNDVDATVRTEVACVAASSFFAGLPEGEIVVLMNCEGAEVVILRDLLDTGTISRISHLLVDFDIRKVVGLEHLEEGIRAELAAVPDLDAVTQWPEAPTHQEQVAAWLTNLA